MAAPVQEWPIQVWAPLVALAGSILLAFAGWSWRQWERRHAAAKSRSRALVALEAEIGQKLNELDHVFDAFRVDDLIARMGDDPEFVPFVPLQPYAAPIHDLVLPDLLTLPKEVVHEVSLFYAADRALHAGFATLTSAEFAALAPDRRINVWNGIPPLVERHRKAGGAALQALAAARQRRRR